MTNMDATLNSAAVPAPGEPDRALVEAQQRGLPATLKQYLSHDDGDAGANQTPPPDLPWIPRPKKAAGNKPPEQDTKAWRQQMRQQREQLILWWLDRPYMTFT